LGKLSSDKQRKERTGSKLVSLPVSLYRPTIREGCRARRLGVENLKFHSPVSNGTLGAMLGMTKTGELDLVVQAVKAIRASRRG
jgi:hypothetical protein